MFLFITKHVSQAYFFHLNIFLACTKYFFYLQYYVEIIKFLTFTKFHIYCNGIYYGVSHLAMQWQRLYKYNKNIYIRIDDGCIIIVFIYLFTSYPFNFWHIMYIPNFGCIRNLQNTIKIFLVKVFIKNKFL